MPPIFTNSTFSHVLALRGMRVSACVLGGSLCAEVVHKSSLRAAACAITSCVFSQPPSVSDAASRRAPILLGIEQFSSGIPVLSIGL